MIKIPSARPLTPEEQVEYDRNMRQSAIAQSILEEGRMKGYFSENYYEDFFPNLTQVNTQDNCR